MASKVTQVVGVAVAVAAVTAASGPLVRAQLPQPVGTWAAAGAIGDPRAGAAAVPLPDGRTLIAGGQLADGTVTDTIVLYDPSADAFTSVGRLLAPRIGHTATLLEDGRVLITGGTVDNLTSADLEVFDPSTGSSQLVTTLAEPRTGHAAARLSDGRVLMAGGIDAAGTVLKSTELFDPATGSMVYGTSMASPREGASATTLIDGRVLIAGGHDGAQDLASAELYEPFSGTFLSVDTALSLSRRGHTAVLLPHNNSVLVAGGTSNGEAVTSTDLFLPALFPDPYSYGMGSFTSTSAMAAGRAHAFAGAGAAEGSTFVAGGGSPDVEVYRFATIKTDKDDYAPGELAMITGSGWQPGEDVTLVFQEDPAVHDDYMLTVTADAAGNIYYDEWAPEEHDLGVRFYLMAFDSTSRAQTTFTDSRPTSLTVGLQTPDPVTAGNSAEYMVAIAFTANPNPCSVSLTVTTTLPVGANAVFAPNPATNTGGSSSASAVLTISTTASTPAGTTPFTVEATKGSDCQPGGPNTVTGSGMLVVQAAAADTTLDVSSASSTYGDGSVLLSATVSSTSTVTGGTVTFRLTDGITTIGAATISSPVSSGSASVAYTLPAGTNAGAYTIEADYNGATGFNPSTGTGALTIDPATLTVNAVAASKIYGQADPAFTYTLAGFAFGEDASTAAITGEATCSRTPGEALTGSPYTITCGAGTLTAANYGFVTGDTAAFTINPATLAVNAVAASKTYGQADPTFTYTLAGFAFGEDASSAGVAGDAECSRTPGDAVTGSPYTITCAAGTLAAANYVFVTGDMAAFTIIPATLAVNAVAASKIYGQADPTFTYTLAGFVFGEGASSAGVSGEPTCSRTSGEAVAGSPYTITCAPGTLTAPNYIFATGDTAPFTINPATLAVNAVAASKTYGQADPVFTYTLAGFAFSEDANSVGVTGDGACSRTSGEAVAGSPYTITCEPGTLAAANYVFTTGATAAFTITPATLAVNAVGASKIYGQADPAFTHTLAGFAFGEDASSAGVEGDGECSRTSGEAVVGTPYTITCAPGTLTAANYIFVVGVTAEFTINPATLAVNAVAASKTYGQADPVFTYTLAGFVFGEDPTTAGVDGNAACSRTAGETVVGSPYVITCAPGTLTAANYVFTTGATAAFTITSAPLTITANDQSKIFGATLTFAGTEFTSAGLVSGDAIASVTLASAGAAAAAAVGTYPIGASNAVGVGLTNYTITYIPGTLTVHYAVCAYYDQNKSHQRNSTIPIKIALCDAGGINVSAPDTLVQATGLIQVGSSAPAILAEDAGTANPDYNFRYAGGFYIFNLSLKNSGVGQGEWLMSFSVSGTDHPAYSLKFFVK